MIRLWRRVSNTAVAAAHGVQRNIDKKISGPKFIRQAWDRSGDIGTAAAIKEAGLQGKVFLATSGGGEQKGACDQVLNGSFDYDISYDVPTQASTMAAMIKFLIQSKVKPGDAQTSIYTTLIPITKENAGKPGTCWTLNKT